MTVVLNVTELIYTRHRERALYFRNHNHGSQLSSDLNDGLHYIIISDKEPEGQYFVIYFIFDFDIDWVNRKQWTMNQDAISAIVSSKTPMPLMDVGLLYLSIIYSVQLI